MGFLLSFILFTIRKSVEKYICYGMMEVVCI